MLTSISIRNFILIDTLDISFGQGLCVLTGETGAGKSILMDALGFALGQRASARLLRHGAQRGSVTAVFSIDGNDALRAFLEEQVIDVEDEIILRRIIHADGKSKAFINDVAVGVSLLNKVAQKIIEIHGQHDQKDLFDVGQNRGTLDRYGQLTKEVENVEYSFDKYKEIQESLSRLIREKEASEQQEDYLKFVVDELEKLDPKEGEEVELAEKRSILMNKEKIVLTARDTNQLLAGESDRLREAQSALSRQSNLHDDFAVMIDSLERAAIEVEEVSQSLDRIATSVEDGDENAEYVEERLFALRGIARKYGVTVDQLCEYKEQMTQKLDVLSDHDSQLDSLKAQLDKARKDYVDAASKLSSKRKAIADKMEQALQKELAPLKMQSTRFKVQLEALPEEAWSSSGADKVMFLVSTNPGAPLGPLSKVASGGELSRLMLAMKVVLQEVLSTSCMIFDEVDTGIGGAVADAVGKRLELLGKKVQLLVITHQPQVAAKGDYHLKVVKEQRKDDTVTTVNVLDETERKAELARMLAGERITGQAIAAAESLLEAS